MRVRAWAGSWALRDPRRAVRLAREVGLSGLDIICNDVSKARRRTPFGVRSSAQICALAEACHEGDLEVHLMAWAMPHREYIHEAADVLLPLVEMTGAASVQWDAEEPWTQAVGGLDWSEAAILIRDEMAEAVDDMGAEMGVNGIGWAPARALGPLAAVCDYVVPQLYVTRTSGLSVSSLPRLHARWRDRIAPASARVVVGLAAYRQRGIPGYAVPGDALGACLREASSLDAADVVVWQLKSLAGRLGDGPALRRVVRGWTTGDAAGVA